MSGGLGEDVLAEALSTTSIGTGSRSISWVPAVTTNAEVTAEPIEEEISGPIICHRVTAPSSVFTIEIGASGCMMTGGVRNFASSMSGHVMVLYYPFTARSMSTSDDDAVSLRQTSFTNIYINGTAGFSKITLSDPLTPLSYTVDNLDAGLGIGYSYRLFKYVAIGMEGSYVYSSSLSPEVASGSSSLIQVLAGITVFL
jgi:hypothetical protein